MDRIDANDKAISELMQTNCEGFSSDEHLQMAQSLIALYSTQMDLLQKELASKGMIISHEDINATAALTNVIDFHLRAAAECRKQGN